MSTIREITYLILDELKLSSDDSTFTENHIIYLINNYRALLLKQRYSDIKKTIPSSNYIEICLEMEEFKSPPSRPCEEDFYYIRSTKKIPSLMSSGNTKVYNNTYFNYEIPYINRERFNYVGYSKYVNNTIYSTRGADGFLYLKSKSTNINNLKNLKMYALFQDVIEASELLCDNIKACNILDREFPLENALIPPLVQLVVEELRKSIYLPEDKENNADDDLSDINIKQR